jgi:hypothetical protein
MLRQPSGFEYRHISKNHQRWHLKEMAKTLSPSKKIYKKIYLDRKDPLYEHFFLSRIWLITHCIIFPLSSLSSTYCTLCTVQTKYNSKQTMSLSMCFLVPQFHTLNCTDKLATWHSSAWTKHKQRNLSALPCKGSTWVLPQLVMRWRCKALTGWGTCRFLDFSKKKPPSLSLYWQPIEWA